MAFITKKQKSLDQILSTFTQVSDELGDALKNLAAEKTRKEQEAIVLRTQMEELNNQSIRAAQAYQKVQELLGE